jgi:hypothetical protein
LPFTEQLLAEHENGFKPTEVHLPNIPDALPDAGRTVVAFIELVIGLNIEAGEDGPYEIGCAWLGKKTGVPKVAAWRGCGSCATSAP